MKSPIILAVAAIVLAGCSGGDSKTAAETTTTGATPPPTTTPAEAPKPPVEAPEKRIGIVDLKPGTGEGVKPGDSLWLDYTGTLKNGKKFDSSIGKYPLAMVLGSGAVIKGWDLGLVGMKLGGERKLTIPADLAYGANSPSPDIPPNSDLVFTVKLLGIVRPGEEMYIDRKDEKVGTGSRTVKDGDTVAIDYVGTLLNGQKFDSSFDRKEPLEFKVGAGQVVTGMEEGVKGMKVGGVREIRMPPATAYGPEGRPPAIPSNSMLIFKVTLRAIK